MANKRLIDANALLKELRQELRDCQKDADEFGGENILWAEGIEFAIDTVKQTKTVDAVEVVRGRWIETVWNERGIQKDCYGTLVPQYMCSVCAREEMIKEPYCHCGAKMDGGNENDL